MKLLIVESESEFAGYIGRGLSALGHNTAITNTGAAALSACATDDFDAIVLDRTLPDSSGIAVIGQLRAGSGNRAPILMMSTFSSVDDRIQGLQAGADDYLTRPFELAELNARIAAVVRRNDRKSRGGDLAVGRLSLDPMGHRACFADREISLNRKEYSLLAFLMRHVDRVVSRAMLFGSVWNLEGEPTTNVVESNLSRLRGQLQKVGCDPIETRRGQGYILRSECCAGD